MPDIALRGVPDSLHNELKSAATRNHRSLNGEILARRCCPTSSLPSRVVEGCLGVRPCPPGTPSGLTRKSLQWVAPAEAAEAAEVAIVRVDLSLVLYREGGNV